jgi:hypothetical protein
LSTKEAGRGYGSAYYDDQLWTGALRIINGGCENYVLLIVTGAERGNLWYDARHDALGIFPLAGPLGARVQFDGLQASREISRWFPEAIRRAYAERRPRSRAFLPYGIAIVVGTLIVGALNYCCR